MTGEMMFSDSGPTSGEETTGQMMGVVVVVLQAVKTTKRTGDSLGRIIMYEKDLLKKPHVLFRGKNCYYFFDVLFMEM